MSESIDVVFSFDCTGSMSACIGQVRDEIVDLVNTLFAEIPSIRIGIIAHGDYCDAPKTISLLDLTTDRKQIVQFVRSVPDVWGGDAPECYELVLHETRKFNWQSGTSKVLVLIGDDVPHGPNYPENVKKLNWRNELGLLQEAGVHVYGVQALGRKHATPFYTEIAELSGGFRLELAQFSHIEDLIKAVCFKQVSNERLQAFEQELTDSGRLDRGLDTIICVLSGRSSKRHTKRVGTLVPVPAGRFQVLKVKKDIDIKSFAESKGLKFAKGRGFYEFTVPVTVQAYKEIVLMENSTGDMFTGTAARDLAGIPQGVDAKVYPGAGKLSEYTCFIQSTSSNRKLLAGTKFLYEIDDWDE